MALVFLGKNKEIHEFNAEHVSQLVQRQSRRVLRATQDMGQMPLAELVLQIEAVQRRIAIQEELPKAFSE